ncbi:MAG: RHS repeat domain-containing protein, partial [Gammaproteobacteria bacterium]
MVRTFASATYSPGVETRHFPYAQQVIQRSYEVGGDFNGVLVRTIATTNHLDNATGTVDDSTTTVTEGTGGNGLNPGQSFSFRTYSATLFNDFPNWCIGRPASTQQINSHTGDGGAELTRTSGVTWDGEKCRPSQQIIEPDDTEYQVTSDIVYDDFGNPSQVTATPASGQGQAARVTMIHWGSDGQFPLSITNPKSQVTQLGWNTAFGLRASVTDPNNLATTWQYDNFGRMTGQQQPDGTAIELLRYACTSAGSCGPSDLRAQVDAAIYDTASNLVRVDSQFFDGFERLRFSRKKLLSGADSTSRTEYDALGRVASQSAPYIGGIDPIQNTTYSYDLLGRVKQIQRPVNESDSSTHLTQFEYDGLQHGSTDALDRTTLRRFNAVG